eukprot:4936564-Pyramimonas_sp.AAC.1
MDACHAGASGGGSVQAQSADVAGITSSGFTPSDTLYVNDPWRVHVQQLPAPSGKLASFAPMSRAATPF